MKMLLFYQLFSLYTIRFMEKTRIYLLQDILLLIFQYLSNRKLLKNLILFLFLLILFPQILLLNIILRIQFTECYQHRVSRYIPFQADFCLSRYNSISFVPKDYDFFLRLRHDSIIDMYPLLLYLQYFMSRFPNLCPFFCLLDALFLTLGLATLVWRMIRNFSLKFIYILLA